MPTCRITPVLLLSLGCLGPNDGGAGCSALAGRGADKVSVVTDDVGERAPLSGAIEPLPTTIEVDPKQAALGERIFADARLSGDQQVACAHCHMLAKGGANGEARSSLRVREKPVGVNVPTFFNVAFEFRYAWDGRFKTLEEQLEFAMTSPNVMAGTFADAALRLSADEALAREFRDAYPAQGLTGETLRDALVAYCRSATTPNSRFDRFLRGTLELTEQEARGYDAFRDYGCISCHQGVNVGGNMFQQFGVMRPYFDGSRPTSKPDLGRFNTTHEDRDRHVFRVPSLRNVALTAPYFHDGSAATLEEAITVMARYQLGRELSFDRTREISAFLRSLTGEYRGAPL